MNRNWRFVCETKDAKVHLGHGIPVKIIFKKNRLKKNACSSEDSGKEETKERLTNIVMKLEAVITLLKYLL